MKAEKKRPPCNNTDSPLRILHITDTHLFAGSDGALLGLNTATTLQNVLRHAESGPWPPNMILTTGDISHDESRESYRRFLRILAPLNIPTYCLPGNHDMPELMGEEISSSLVRCPAVIRERGWQLILLDSTIPGSEGGHFSATCLERLEQTLKSGSHLHTMVCLHHSPITLGSAWLDSMSIDNAADLFRIVDRHPQVRALLWGHVHQEVDERRNGIRLLASPSTCIQFKPRSKDFTLDSKPPGYRWLNLYPDGTIQTQVGRLE